jgi:hypothetical protein
MTVAMILTLLLLVIIAFRDDQMRSVTLLKFILVALFLVVFFMKYHSPQYFVWFTPFVCLLIADRLYAVILFFVAQVITYIEFPLAFGVLYTNGEYLSPVHSSGHFLTMIFFTVEYLVMILLIWMAIQPSKKCFAAIIKNPGSQVISWCRNPKFPNT